MHYRCFFLPSYEGKEGKERKGKGREGKGWEGKGWDGKGTKDTDVLQLFEDIGVPF